MENIKKYTLIASLVVLLNTIDFHFNFVYLLSLFTIVLFFALSIKVLHRLLGSDAGPNKVQEIKTDSLGSLPVLQRDEGMVLYGPPLTVVSDRKIQYEIVLNRPCSDNLSTAYRYT